MKPHECQRIMISQEVLVFKGCPVFNCNLILLFSSKASMVKLPEDEDTPEKRVNRIFSQMDTVSHYTYCTFPFIDVKLIMRAINELHSDRQWNSNICYYPLIRHQQQKKAEVTMARPAQYLLAEILTGK